MDPKAVPLRSLDFLGATLFVSSLILTLVELSIASSIYTWTSWQALSLLSLGTLTLAVFISRELCPNRFCRTQGGNAAPERMFLDIRLFEPAWALTTWLGALVLGFVVSCLY